MPELLHWLMPLIGILLAATIWHRVRRGIAQI
jgi:CDP-diacylglycerol---glycerol-3-phosphate 3-phosphatidyltransferase